MKLARLLKENIFKIVTKSDILSNIQIFNSHFIDKCNSVSHSRILRLFLAYSSIT